MSATDLLPRLLDRLDGVKPIGSGWTARCPAHDDRHNSLKVDVGKDGQALIHCHAGCDQEAVVAALGLTFSDLYPPRADAVTQNGHGRRIVATYNYLDETGTLLYQVARYWPKDFRQRKPDGRGGWDWKLGDTRRVLYRLPELLASDPAAWVIIPEGERDVDGLRELGSVATTNAGGAGKWRPDYTEALRGRRVVVLPDNDEPGEQHALTVARSLRSVASEVRVLHLPGLPAKADVTDWLHAGGTVDELWALIEQAPAWHPDGSAEASTHEQPPKAARLVVRSLHDVIAQPVAWDWHRWLPRGKFTLVGGHAGDGKSTLLAALAAIGSRGGEWPDGTLTPRRLRTLFILGEDSAADTLKPRLALHEADMQATSVIEAVLDEKGQERFFNVSKHLDLLEATVIERAIDWIIIDPLTTIMPGADRNAEGDTRDALTPLTKLAERLNVTITGVAHVGKSESSRRAAQKILGATAFHAMARVVWMIAPEEDERMVLGVVKSNLAMKPPSLVWSREEDGLIRWVGVAAQDVEDLLSGAPMASPRADAEGFLRDYLAGGSRPSADVEQAAKASGISKATLRRAADAIPVKRWKASGANGVWYWSLPDGQPRHAQTPEPSDESNLLTPRDIQVSKLSKFHGDNLLNGESSGHLLTTTPVFTNGHANDQDNVVEGAQLAQAELLRGEQVPIRVNDDAVVELAQRLAELSSDELQNYRDEVAAALSEDPHIHQDRQALALFDAAHYSGIIA